MQTELHDFLKDRSLGRFPKLHYVEGERREEHLTQRVAQDGNLRSGVVRDYYVVDEALFRDGVVGRFVRRNKEPGPFSTVILDEDAMALFLSGWREVVREGRYLDADLS